MSAGSDGETDSDCLELPIWQIVGAPAVVGEDDSVCDSDDSIPATELDPIESIDGSGNRSRSRSPRLAPSTPSSPCDGSARAAQLYPADAVTHRVCQHRVEEALSNSFDYIDDGYGFLQRHFEQERLAASPPRPPRPVILPCAAEPVISFAQHCKELARALSRAPPIHGPAVALLRGIGPAPSSFGHSPAAALIHEAVVEASTDLRQHQGQHGVFFGFQGRPEDAISVCRQLARWADAFYIGATCRTPTARWRDQPSPHHDAGWHRLYSLCRVTGSEVVALERSAIAAFLGNRRMSNRGGGGEHIDRSAPYAYLYMCVTDLTAAAGIA